MATAGNFNAAPA